MKMSGFVLEGDFGAGQQINQFIINGNGTAEETVNALDYGIYQTEQMIESCSMDA